MRNLVACAAGLLAGAACNTLPAEDRPALVVDPTPASRAELAQAVTEALHGAPVTLADDALTRQSFLVIERRPRGDLESRPLGGRVLEEPERFSLVLSGSRCFLVHLPDGDRRELTETTCRPE